MSYLTEVKYDHALKTVKIIDSGKQIAGKNAGGKQAFLVQHSVNF